MGQSHRDSPNCMTKEGRSQFLSLEGPMPFSSSLSFLGPLFIELNLDIWQPVGVQQVVYTLTVSPYEIRVCLRFPVFLGEQAGQRYVGGSEVPVVLYVSRTTLRARRRSSTVCCDTCLACPR